MARSLRIEFPGAFYHVMSRGNEKRDIYRNRYDRIKFLGYLESASTRYGAVIHSYCLMNNHYHLIIETPDGNLAQIMRHINGAYTAYFNTRHSRVGHLFQGRYRSILVDVDNYCLTVSRYIHLNPVKDGLASNPAEYEWSSYRYFMNKQESVGWLNTDFLLALLGDGSGVRKRYQKYIEESDSDNIDLYGKCCASMAILGREEFVEEVKNKHVAGLCASRDLPATKELRFSPTIPQVVAVVADLIKTDHRLAKKISIYLCHQYSGCSLREIGEYFGIGESAVSANSARFAMMLCRDQRLAEIIAELLVELKK